MRFGIPSTLAVVGVAAITLAADDLGPVKERAVRLYDQGNFDEARKTLQELDNARALDGPLLYRLFFCQKAAGHDDEARKALDRARSALEGELAASASLEVAFYLANTYANLGRAADAKRVAHEMTAPIESGSLAAPKSAIALFQIGKLYQDQGRQAEATAFYQKAVDAFDLADGRYVGNARWALRFLGNNAFSRADFAAAERALARLTALEGAEAADWDALAAARARLAMYAPAAEAWKASVKLDPAEADDARYAARLADAAALLAPLPAGAPGGAAFPSMNQADLEAFLKARSEAVIASQTRLAEAMRPEKDGMPARPSDPKLRAETAASLLETRRLFVAAGLEYAVRGYGIRETAFREGYAVLIFQDRAWELPPDPEPAAGDAGRSGS
jgi:tetratricopeptide (TPR) repeat protein